MRKSIYKKASYETAVSGGAHEQISSSPNHQEEGGSRRVWCWWEHDNENGITPETLAMSNTLWDRGVQQWTNGDYLPAMAKFQQSLAPYHSAWPYIGKGSGTNERREGDLTDFFERSVRLAKRLLFCAYCELDASEFDSARQRLVQCLSILMTVYFTSPSREGRESIRNVMSDAWMELMLRYVVCSCDVLRDAYDVHVR